MTKVPYTITQKGASLYINGRMHTVAATSANFSDVVAELRKPVHDLSVLEQFADISTFIAKKTFGAVQIADNEVRWKGTKVHNVIADRLLAMLDAGDDLEPLALFLGRLMLNPVESAREELFLWLESGNAPITPTGTFLAFKKVRDDYLDFYTGSVSNKVGEVVWMNREAVDPDRERTCSQGLHFCSYDYLPHYHGNQGRVMVVQIDPADVVAVPHDYSNQKGRTWRYLVVGEIPQDEAKQFFSGSRVVIPYVSPVVTVTAPEDLDDAEGQNDEGDISGDEDIVANEQEDEAPKTDRRGKPKLMFYSSDGKRSFLASEILNLREEHGQRGTARLIGVPRTTIQEWLKAIAAQ